MSSSVLSNLLSFMDIVTFILWAFVRVTSKFVKFVEQDWFEINLWLLQPFLTFTFLLWLMKFS